MSNVLQYSLLIIATIVVCITTPLLTTHASAQSDLLYPVVHRVSYQAPDLDAVFEGRKHYRIGAVTKVVVVDRSPANLRETKKVKRKVAKMEKHIASEIEEMLREIADLEREIAVLKAERQIAQAEKRIIGVKKVKNDFTAADFGCGSCGSHVKELQTFLNSNGFSLATDGVGSKGLETEFFGPKTLTALKQFQLTYGIPVTGVVDAKTRYLIRSIDRKALGSVTSESCVSRIEEKNTLSQSQKEKTKKKKDMSDTSKKEVSEIPQDDGKSTSGNFFANLMQSILSFFRNLFVWR